MQFDDIPVGAAFRRPNWDSGLFLIKVRNVTLTTHATGYSESSYSARYVSFEKGVIDIKGGQASDEVLARGDFILVNLKSKVMSSRVRQIYKEHAMENVNVNYVGGEYNVVKVYYISMDSTKTYNFKIDADIEVTEGDILVVEASNGLGLVCVKEFITNSIVNAKEVKKATAWVVDKVDMSRQKERKEATYKREYIIQQLEEKKKQMEAVEIYAFLAKIDPEAEKLLTELKSLSK